MSDVTPWVPMVQADGVSPFDVIRKADERGEYWSARDLMTMLGYATWPKFRGAIERAIESCRQTGHDQADHFTSEVVRIVPTAGAAVSGGNGISPTAMQGRVAREIADERGVEVYVRGAGNLFLPAWTWSAADRRINREASE